MSRDHAGAPIPANEAERLAELYGYAILDTAAEDVYDDITYLASLICETPVAVMSLVDRDRQWFKSKVGIEADETTRDLAFCAHAVWDPSDILVVDDAAQDFRFSNNPLVIGEPFIRFYAGAPLLTSTGNALGTLCVIDRQPRELTADQEQAMRSLSRVAMRVLDHRKLLGDLAAKDAA